MAEETPISDAADSGTVTTSEPKPLPRARRYFLGVNGLNTRASNPHNWNASFLRYVTRETPDVAGIYLPETAAWNRWRKRKHQIGELVYCIRDGVMAEDALCLVGHSDGVPLILDTLWERDALLVKELHLIAGAAQCDCNRNHLNQIMERNQVEATYIYASSGDTVLRDWAAADDWIEKIAGWFGKDAGFGQLGFAGPCELNLDTAAVVRVLWSHDLWGHHVDHSGWFDDDHRRETFLRITNSGGLPSHG